MRCDDLDRPLPSLPCSLFVTQITFQERFLFGLSGFRSLLHDMDVKAVVYSAARKDIRDGDLLMFRSRDWYTRLFAIAGRTEYVHAAMAGWWNGRLMCVEMTSSGGRAQLLSNIVAQWPGVCDVYRANAARRRFSRQKALLAMIAITGKPYGRWNLWRAALLHLPLLRFCVRPDMDDAEESAWPPFCSQAVSMACRAGGVDPVPHLADRLTEPADLARSSFFQYRFTLGGESNANVQ